MSEKFLTVEFSSVSYSQDLSDFLIDEVPFAFDGINYLHIGYKKPFNDIYIELHTPVNSAPNNFEYYDGSTWNTLETIDETKGFAQSGFIFFTKPSDWAAVDVNGLSKFYIRVLKGNTETVTINGINTVFSNDNDLSEVYRKINSFKEQNDVSFIAHHQAARKDIIQLIRNGRKTKTTDEGIADVIVWDLLKRDQLRRASTYLALSSIFFNVSDSSDGKFYQLATDYRKQAQKAVEVYLLDIDKNDDGASDSNPLSQMQITELKYL